MLLCKNNLFLSGNLKMLFISPDILIIINIVKDKLCQIGF